MGWYLYGVTATDGPSAAPRDLRGIDEAEIRLLGDGELRLVVSPLRRDIEDLQQAEPEFALDAVQRHDVVLSALARLLPVVPVRFGTVLPDDAAADELLADPGGALSAALTAVTGADEWVIRVDTLDPTRTVDNGAGELTPGHAFFARKRSEAQARTDARARAATAVEDLTRRLAPLVRDARELPPREPTTVARIAYLVDRRETDRFLATAGSCDGASTAVQGPLPPYRFVAVPSR